MAGQEKDQAARSTSNAEIVEKNKGSKIIIHPNPDYIIAIVYFVDDWYFFLKLLPLSLEFCRPISTALRHWLEDEYPVIISPLDQGKIKKETGGWKTSSP